MLNDYNIKYLGMINLKFNNRDIVTQRILGNIYNENVIFYKMNI